MTFLDEVRQKVHPRSVGVSIFVHELSGLGWLIGAWSFFYLINPTESILKKHPKLNEYQNRAQLWTNRKMEKMPSMIRNSKRINVQRLATSGIESYLFRTFLRPITIPGKIALAVYVGNLYGKRMYGSIQN